MRQAGGSAWHLAELLKRLRRWASDYVIDIHLSRTRPILFQLKLPAGDPSLCFYILAEAIHLESLIGNEAMDHARAAIRANGGESAREEPLLYFHVLHIDVVYVEHINLIEESLE